MACYHPISAFRNRDGSIRFSNCSGTVGFISLPCGRCIGCRLERSRQWSVRIMHEAKLHSDNCFVTLTYDDEHLPQFNSLHYPDFQLFMKRLRKHFKGSVIRFFMCGEYGDKERRPHYHICLFNVKFSDLEVIRGGKNPLFTSRTLSRLWPHGFNSVGALNHQSAAYVARYVVKKVTGDAAKRHYEVLNYETGEISNIVPEFCHMSLKPGIGAGWYDKFKSDVFPHDRVIVDGRPVSPPKYYFRKFLRSNPEAAEVISNERALFASRRIRDATRKRLDAREYHHELVYKQLYSRDLE